MTHPTLNRRVLLAARPQGRPVPGDFRIDRQPVPEPGEGQVLLRTLWLSLDPYMRNLMDEVGPGYAPPVALGQPMVGGTVSRVVASRYAGLREGDTVLANAGWQDFALAQGRDVQPLASMAEPSHALGGLGMPGFTAHVGLLDIGQPRAGETLVVAAATGAVGALVGQIGKRKGLRVVGIAGSAQKARHAVEALGFDACLDRRAPLLPERLAAACPQGIDIYFENVGGAVLDAVLPLLNVGSRMPVCGFAAHYNDLGESSGPDRRARLLATVLQKRVRMQGFIILDHYGERFEVFQREMGDWVASGGVRLDEVRIDGLENAAAALVDLLDGRHLGKVVVRVAQEPPATALAPAPR